MYQSPYLTEAQRRQRAGLSTSLQEVLAQLDQKRELGEVAPASQAGAQSTLTTLTEAVARTRLQEALRRSGLSEQQARIGAGSTIPTTQSATAEEARTRLVESFKRAGLSPLAAKYAASGGR